MPLHDFRNECPKLCDYLLNVSRTERIGHAYLVAGDDIAFLEQFARAWIQVCACTSRRTDGEACGECTACRQLTRGTYSDLSVLRPTSRSRQIRVGAVRDFDHQLALTAPPGRLKAGLIVEADRLVVQGQNAFLKTLEEPPRQCMLVLVSTQPRNLLPTIRSRCQTVSVLKNKLSYESAAERGLFSILPLIRRGAGAATPVRAAHHLGQLFNTLKKEADQNVPAIEEAYLEDQDNAAIKRQEAIRDAQVESEYRRLKKQLMDGIDAWFLQQALAAAGTPADALPNPELLEAAEVGLEEFTPGSWQEADTNVAYVDELRQCLEGNVNDHLALQAFCLATCKRSAN